MKERIAFKMYLKNGCEEDFKKRYNALWPDLKELLKEKGILDFSIYFDKETNALFVYQTSSQNIDNEELNKHLILKKWWEYMADIIETDKKNQPIILSLEELFHIDWID